MQLYDFGFRSIVIKVEAYFKVHFLFCSILNILYPDNHLFYFVTTLLAIGCMCCYLYRTVPIINMTWHLICFMYVKLGASVLGNRDGIGVGIWDRNMRWEYSVWDGNMG